MSTILAIETSCDETSVAVMQDGKLLSNEVYSQLDLHKQYGGVVPSIARLAHEQKIDEVLSTALDIAKVKLSEITHVAVTQGPGLAIALEVGIRKAKQIASEYNLPLLGVNHMAGHLYSGLDLDEFASQDSDKAFPSLGLLVSGGHSEILLLSDLYSIQKVGWTVDDACGEAFDKFATMLGLEYPGGPVVSKLAAQYRGNLELKIERDQQTLFVRGVKDGEVKYQLPIPMANSGDLNMSYSGLKTAVKQIINQLSGTSQKLDIRETAKETIRAEALSEEQIGELCVVFEMAAIYTLILKLEAAVNKFSPKGLWLGGGVVSNGRLQAMVQELAGKHDLQLKIASDRKLLTDNAGMIAMATHIALKQLDEQGRISENIAKLYQAEGFEGMDRLPNWEL